MMRKTKVALCLVLCFSMCGLTASSYASTPKPDGVKIVTADDLDSTAVDKEAEQFIAALGDVSAGADTVTGAVDDAVEDGEITKEEIDNINKQLEDLSNAVGHVNDGVYSKLESISVAVSNNGLSISAVKSDLNTVLEKVEALDTAIKGVEEICESIQTGVEEIQDMVERLQAALNLLTKVTMLLEYELIGTTENPGVLIRMEAELKGQIPAVTAVYSVNMSLPNCYYKPQFADIAKIKPYLLKNEELANVYTEYFDYVQVSGDEVDSVVAKGYTDANGKWVDYTSRALEILGYDLLLQEESYDFNSGKYVTKVVKPGDAVPYSVALMNLYKALGEEEVTVMYKCAPVYFDCVNHHKIEYVTGPSVCLLHSPLGQGLPSYVSMLDGSKGTTRVFASRTNLVDYLSKAEQDLYLDIINTVDKNGNLVLEEDYQGGITGSEFLVLAHRLMNLYGEPVMSELETYQLMQYFGEDIPSYLSAIEQEAYIYLKARGCLAEDLEYDKNITMEQMLDILMRIADVDSRTTYKQIQLSLDISDDLIAKGYYPKTVTLMSGDNHPRVEVVPDYTKVKYYDYYIKLDERTRFLSADGNDTDWVFVAKEPGSPSKGEMSGTEYCGIEYVSGVPYYHFKILASKNGVDTVQYDFEGVKGVEEGVKYFQVNSGDKSDIPHWLMFPEGGGIYTYKTGELDDSGRYLKGILSRQPFPETAEWHLMFDKESIEEAMSKLTAWDKLKRGVTELFGGETAYAKPVEELEAPFTLLVYDSEGNVVKQVVAVGNKDLAKKTNEVIQEVLDENETKAAEDVINCIGLAQISGSNIKVDLNQFIEKGLVYQVDDSEVGTKGILVLHTEAGIVKLNNNLKQVMVGNSIYCVNTPYSLFEYTLSVKGDCKYMVDFRAVYGWTANKVNVDLQGGEGKDYCIAVSDYTDKDPRLDALTVKAVGVFGQSSHETHELWFLKKTSSVSRTQIICNTMYPLANWLVVYGVDDAGKESDYVIVYYNASMFGEGVAVLDDSQKVKELLGYSINVGEAGEGWVCRMYKLDATEEVVEGRFTYNKQYGYVYNVPEDTAWGKESKFTLEKYLPNGDVEPTYMLPIMLQKLDKVYLYNNFNLNIFSDPLHAGMYSEYGTVVYGTSSGTKKGFMHKSPVTFNAKFSSIQDILVAPVGMSAFYGGGTLPYISISSDLLEYYDGTKTSDVSIYYGTTKVASINKVKGGYRLKLVMGNASDYVEVKVPDDTKVYDVGTQYSDGVQRKTYIILTDVLAIDASEEIAGKGYDIEISEDADLATEYYNDFEMMSIEELIYTIDVGTSWLIEFIFRVIPLVCSILLTILVGFALAADSKFVQWFCDKVFDPVYIITLGHIRVEQLGMYRALASLIIGYFVFILMYEGNVLRFVVWASEAYVYIVEALRAM